LARRKAGREDLFLDSDAAITADLFTGISRTGPGRLGIDASPQHFLNAATADLYDILMWPKLA
jgi:hypothetical protein